MLVFLVLAQRLGLEVIRGRSWPEPSCAWSTATWSNGIPRRE
jgi:hypothetical protein